MRESINKKRLPVRSEERRGGAESHCEEMICILLLSVLCTADARVVNLWKRVGFRDSPPNLETRCLASSLGFFIPRRGSAQVLYTVRVLAENHDMATNIKILPSECGYTIQDDAKGVEFTVKNDACCVYTKNGGSAVNIHLEETSPGQATQAWRFTIDCLPNLISLRIGDSSACATALPSLQCGSPRARSDVGACSLSGCCYDPIRQLCLYGEVGCTMDGRFVVTISRNVTSPPLNLSTVYLNSDMPGCGPVILSEDYVVFDFSVNSCGVTTKWNELELIYGAMMTAEHDRCVDGDVAIIRSSTYKLLLECRLLRTDDQAFLDVQVNTKPPPLPATAIGLLSIQLRIATDGGYSDYYSQFPVVKFLRDPIFLEVRLLDHPDPSLVLVLQDCWVTPTADPLNSIQWRVLDNHCPFTGDNYLTVLHPMAEFPAMPLATHYKRFEVKTFVFMDPGGTTVLPNRELYFHCRVYVCQGDDGTCVPTCPSSVLKRHVRKVAHRKPSLISLEGAVILREKNSTGTSPLSSLLTCDDAWSCALLLLLCGLALLAGVTCALLLLSSSYVRRLCAAPPRRKAALPPGGPICVETLSTANNF